MKIRMLARYKKLEPGKTVTVKDQDLAKWLVSRKYAEFAD